MAELVVIGYPDEATAESAFDRTLHLERDMIIELAAAAVVSRSADGKLKVETPTGATAAGATRGAMWGALIGLLFFMPFGGMLVGGFLGGLTGKLAELGIKDEFRHQVQDAVPPGKSALMLIYTKVTPDKALAALAPLGGEVLKTSLSKEAEDELQRTLSEGSAVAVG